MYHRCSLKLSQFEIAMGDLVTFDPVAGYILGPDPTPVAESVSAPIVARLDTILCTTVGDGNGNDDDNGNDDGNDTASKGYKKCGTNKRRLGNGRKFGRRFNGVVQKR
jgi:hypothetical protein